MRKLLILISTFASFFLGACSSDPIANRLPWVYRIDIQQGNVLDQDMVNQIRTGMSKRQVQFVLGAPMLADPFHADRWDYFHLYQPGSKSEGEPVKRNISLFFEGDQLIRIGGTLLPGQAHNGSPRKRHVTVTVPPQEREDPGILTRLWRWMGFGGGDDYETRRDSSPAYDGHDH